MKLCKTTSVFYYFLAFLYAVAAGGAILGWILSGAASVMFGDLGMVLISAVIIAALVLIFGFIFIYVHGALLLRAPRREDTLIYALYEAAGICFAVLHLCAGMVLNAVGIMNVWLSIVYYGVMLTIPLLEQTKKKTVQSAPEREKKQPPKPSVRHGIYVLAGEYEGKMFALDPEEEVVLGTRSDLCNIVFHDPRISRRHCKIQYSEADNVYYVIDYSTNGTFLMDGPRSVLKTSIMCSSSGRHKNGKNKKQVCRQKLYRSGQKLAGLLFLQLFSFPVLKIFHFPGGDPA